MPLPARMLDEDEEVVLDVHRHGWVLAAPVLLGVLAVAAAAAGVVAGVPAVAAWALVALLLLALVHLLGRFLRWRTTSLVLTTRRVVLRSGVIRSSVRELPLAAIGDVSCQRSLWGRVIGAGTVVIETSARDGREVLTDVPDPLGVQLHLLRLRDRSRPGAAALSVPEQLDRLEDLRRRGVLSPEEYRVAKARVLGG